MREIFLKSTGITIEEHRTLPREEFYRRLSEYTGQTYPLPIDTTPTIDMMPLMSREEIDAELDEATREHTLYERFEDWFFGVNKPDDSWDL